jgi:isoquinoline 1-oxidoreductase alpha subunit
MPNLVINGRNMSVDAANDTPLLWVIREQLQMTGTKFGCGAGLAARARCI